MAVVLLIALAVGGRADASSRSPEDRAHAIGETIKCPTCRSQSVASSDSPAAEYIREKITELIADGQSDAEIRDYFASRYGDEILLTPSSSGVAGIVWMAPVAVLVVTIAGVVVAFRRWRGWKAAV
jgi:cytochrome c-type biogenesis protein CcmH